MSRRSRRNPLTDWEAAQLADTLERDFGDIPRARKLAQQLRQADTDVQRDKLRGQTEKFLLGLVEDPDEVQAILGLETEPAGAEPSVEDINAALIAGTLGIGESGRARPMAEVTPRPTTAPEGLEVARRVEERRRRRQGAEQPVGTDEPRGARHTAPQAPRAEAPAGLPSHYLLVKGTEGQAIDAAAAHGLHVLYAVQSDEREETQVWAALPSPDTTVLVNWMSEDRGAPYPPGSLLWYRDISEHPRLLDRYRMLIAERWPDVPETRREAVQRARELPFIWSGDHAEFRRLLAAHNTRQVDGARKLYAVILGAANAIWWTSWADAMEEAGRGAALSGHNVASIAPPTPLRAKALGEALMAKIDRATSDSAGAGGGERHYVLAEWERLVREDGVGNSHIDDFGYYLAMEALGCGVGWADDHAPHELEVPHIEVYLDDPNSTALFASGLEGYGV